MFSCRFRPYRSKNADHDFVCNLVFFSAFERLDLSSEAEKPMQNSGITMLYEPGPWDPENLRSKQPVLHVGYLEHILCRAPLMPCFLDGSSTNTIPISKRGESSAFPHGRTDTRAGAGSKKSLRCIYPFGDSEGARQGPRAWTRLNVSVPNKSRPRGVRLQRPKGSAEVKEMNKKI